MAILKNQWKGPTITLTVAGPNEMWGQINPQAVTAAPPGLYLNQAKTVSYTVEILDVVGTDIPVTLWVKSTPDDKWAVVRTDAMKPTNPNKATNVQASVTGWAVRLTTDPANPPAAPRSVRVKASFYSP